MRSTSPAVAVVALELAVAAVVAEHVTSARPGPRSWRWSPRWSASTCGRGALGTGGIRSARGNLESSARGCSGAAAIAAWGRVQLVALELVALDLDALPAAVE